MLSDMDVIKGKGTNEEREEKDSLKSGGGSFKVSKGLG